MTKFITLLYNNVKFVDWRCEEYSLLVSWPSIIMNFLRCVILCLTITRLRDTCYNGNINAKLSTWKLSEVYKIVWYICIINKY